jgi:hypothetical protein
LLPNGDLLAVGSDTVVAAGQVAADEGRYLMRLSWDNQVLWKRMMFAHHDVEVTPRGQILTLTFQYRRVPEVDPDIDIRDDRLTLLDQDGRITETCSLYDALSARPDVFTFQPVAPKQEGGRQMIDLFHANSVEWMHRKHLQERHPIYSPGNVVVCIRHQDVAVIIDWIKKQVVWAWGQGQVSGPHHATILENGNLLLFDNGLGRDWSRVIELDPLTREIVWEYRAPQPADFYTRGRGASQRLASGNTLMTDSDSGRAFEVTPEGEIVWEFLTPHRGERGQRVTIARTTRYELDYVRQIEGALGETAAVETTAPIADGRD